MNTPKAHPPQQPAKSKPLPADYDTSWLKQGGHYKDLPPHVYSIAAEAYRCLFENDKNQAILISGESGAGKTENAKYCMKLLTSIGQYQMFGEDAHKLKAMPQKNTAMTKSSDMIKAAVLLNSKPIGIEEKILQCNPILEAFGNAKTVRNDNSSRFGKYVRMMVHRQSKQIKGAEIINYLLEKSRITSSGESERNFHIFYQLLVGTPATDLEKFYLAEGGKKLPIDYFRYLKTQSVIKEDAFVRDFTEMYESVQGLGLLQWYESIFRIISAVLLMGNITFDDSGFSGIQISDKTLLKKIGSLIMIDENEMQRAMTSKISSTGQVLGLNKQECENMRDSWAKELYGRLFNWLVVQLNETLRPTEQSNYVCAGLLDIYGFEVFQVNGFEQLMINYTNEKLQQLYIKYVFKEEKNIFAAEGLGAIEIPFTDNYAVIDLIDKPDKSSVFFNLEDTCRNKTADDSTFLKSIRELHKNVYSNNVLLQLPRFTSSLSFIVVHTAKNVEYNVTSFLEKNKDELTDLTLQVTSQSKDALVAKLFELTGAKQEKFLSKKIKVQMQELMDELDRCDAHFIRCIKPNEIKKQPGLIEQDYTLQQIRYLGVLDSLKIRKKNYPIRRSYNLFYKQYGDMTKNKIYPHLVKEGADFRQLTLEMFQTFLPQLGKESVLFGTKRIFIKLEAMPKIDAKYHELIAQKNKYARKIQNSWRIKKLQIYLHKFCDRLKWIKKCMHNFRTRIYYKKMMGSCVKIQRWMKKCVQKMRGKRYKIQVFLIQNAMRRYLALKRFKNLSNNILKIQRFCRTVMKMKQQLRKAFIKVQIQKAIDNAWNVIRVKKAIVIQKHWRGYKCRKGLKKEIRQIEEAGRQCRMRKVMTTIQRHVRGWLVRKRIRRMHEAAYYIQGYFRMIWLSDFFQTLRAKTKIIQYAVRTWLAKNHAIMDKYSKYVMPMEERFTQQKQREQRVMFGGSISSQANFSSTELYDRPLSPFHHPPSPSRLGRNTESPAMSNNTLHHEVTFDEILERDNDPTIQKIRLFGFLLDLEVFSDVSEYYNQSFAQTYKRLFDQCYSNANYLQVFSVGATHACAATSTGRVYSWGMNDFGQLGYEPLSQNPQRPQTIPFQGRIKQLACGSDHTLLLNEEGEVFVCGSNEQGQMLNPKLYYSGLRQVDVPFACKQVQATNHTSFILSEEGKVYTWPVAGQVQSFMPVEVPVPQNITFITAGNEFAILLSQQGQLYSFGENQHGELGQGHQELLIEPTHIESLKGQKISQISAGFKHCIARTTLGKIYVWGWGEFGQLGLGSFSDALSPTPLTVQSSTQVQAGHRSTLVLVDNKQILWAGSNSTITYQSEFCPVRMQMKSTQLCQSNSFSPVRIMTTFSRTLSLTYVTFANHKDMFKNNPTQARGVLQVLSSKWMESAPLAVDPPQIESISKYLLEQHQKIAVPKAQKPANNLAQVGSMRQAKSITQKLFSPKLVTHVRGTETESPTRISRPYKNEQYQDFLQMENVMQQHSIHAPPHSPERNQHISPIHDEEDEDQGDGQWQGQGSVHSTKKVKYLGGQKQNQANRLIQRFKKSNTQGSGKLNNKPTAPPAYIKEQQSLYNPDVDESEDRVDKINKLREIKKRLLALKSTPENQWSPSDHEFLRTIYKSNLSVLLEQIAN